MSVDKFMEDPWRASHDAYARSPLNIQPAPEYASSEVIVSSIYRTVGFAGLGEAKVPAMGRDFDRFVRQISSSKKAGSSISVDTWQTVLHGAVESPRRANQSSRRSLQLSPVVPDATLYSGSARTTGNSWNPGALVRRMVQFGSMEVGSAGRLWRRIFDALSVGEADDLWARWLQGEFEKRRQGSGPSWEFQPIGEEPDLPFDEKARIEFPARQFVRDLEAVIAAKGHMTRRQWISLLEAVLRLGCVTHVLWLCDVSGRLWHAANEVLTGAPVPTENDLSCVLFEQKTPYLVYGNPSLRIIRDYASSYLVARLAINLLAWRMEANGTSVADLSSIGAIRNFLLSIEASRGAFEVPKVKDQLDALHEKQARALACKKGIGSNMMEFSLYVLGQRQTANESLRGYDQGYFLRKKGQHASAPWVVSMGPVAVLALVHCCLKQVAGPRSVDRLCQHLSQYRLGVDLDDIAESDLGQKLRMLGLVLDSPDAESGMLLVPPFAVGEMRNGGTT